MNKKFNNTNKNEYGKKKEEEKKKNEFEFCNVCRVNHNEGPRHKYFPKHKQSLSAFLSRFQNKLADVRFFLRNPSILRPEHASRNRLWCVFCDEDLLELDSQFACGNAINHLAGADHLKNLKHFLWINGEGMDRMDVFRISEADLAKWEKKCKSLTDGAFSGDKLSRLQVGPSNDIHNELEQNHENINNFERNYVFERISSNLSNAVVPLQYYTNEYQISYSKFSAVANVGEFAQKTISDSPVDVYSGTDLWSSNDLAGHGNTEHCLGYKTATISNNLSSGEYNQVDGGARILHGVSCAQGLQTIPEISGEAREKSGGNVHTGAPPPWLEAIEDHKPISSSSVSLPNKHKKSQKLNPKRVGAAWAEKRKIELEMEKRGDIVKNDCDANWLPNFGRVWQSGSRKESRKEFEMEEKKLPNVENYSEVRHNVPNIDDYLEEPAPLQPYISKRTRMASQKVPREEFEEGQKFSPVESHSEEMQKLAIRSQSEVPILLQPYISKRMRQDASK